MKHNKKCMNHMSLMLVSLIGCHCEYTNILNWRPETVLVPSISKLYRKELTLSTSS